MTEWKSSLTFYDTVSVTRVAQPEIGNVVDVEGGVKISWFYILRGDIRTGQSQN